MNINFNALYYAAKFHRDIVVVFGNHKFKDVADELEWDLRTRRDFGSKHPKGVVTKCGAKMTLSRKGDPERPTYNLQGGHCE